MCGSPTGGCNPQALVNYLGNNPEAPFLFTVNITDNEFDYNATIHVKPANSTMFTCSQALKSKWFNAPACGCSVSRLKKYQ